MISFRNATCAAGVALALAVGATQAHGSPVPDDAGSDCGWHENGTTIAIDEHTFTCHCAQLTGPMGPQVLCRWYRDDALPAKSKKLRAHSAKPKVKRLILRIAIRPGVTA